MKALTKDKQFLILDMTPMSQSSVLGSSENRKVRGRAIYTCTTNIYYYHYSLVYIF
jgi:hypothetical protein